ncbi:hypothetical protein [Ferrovum myxofaciens]|uniref:hypothetical protein n=1 Tax=Ferrovum myxofaciens TaxID=416213 RepID=UPI0004E18130|nr:hypothetical protein [Ferrovum myxofaciens]
MKNPSQLLHQLRTRYAFSLRYLPETIRIPALEGHRADEVVRPMEEATVDDLSFAIQGLDEELSVQLRDLRNLRDLYELARKRGAIGTCTVAEAFADIGHEEESK